MWLLTLCNMFLLLKKDGIISIKYLKKFENVLLKWCLRFFYVMEKRQLLLILQRTTKYNFIGKEK